MRKEPTRSLAKRIDVAALLGLLVLSTGVAHAHGQEAPHISEGQRGKDGIITHMVEFPGQTGRTQIKVLLPNRLIKGKHYQVVYVLPVEALDGKQYGDGLAEIKKLDLHNKYEIICVQVTFTQLPWYADHPTNPSIRQETYLLQVVLPFIEKTYPVMARSRGRLLVGFSKSGWGAFSLLLRNTQVFGKAAAWDAPLAMTAPNRFGMEPIFGTQENFEKYRITALLKTRAHGLGREPRLGLIGTRNFRDHHERIHEQMVQLQIPHYYVDIQQGPHTWGGGWLPDAMQWIMR
jgi:hypothetical protein